MIDRKGLLQEVLSDKGGNFVGADKELRELTRKPDKDKIQKSAAQRHLK